MKTVKVYREGGRYSNEWEALYEGGARIKVVLDPQDQEATQVESYIFDPYANPEKPDLTPAKKRV